MLNTRCMKDDGANLGATHSSLCHSDWTGEAEITSTERLMGLTGSH